jgi:hypothetical protein
LDVRAGEHGAAGVQDSTVAIEIDREVRFGNVNAVVALPVTKVSDSVVIGPELPY